MNLLSSTIILFFNILHIYAKKQYTLSRIYATGYNPTSLPFLYKQDIFSSLSSPRYSIDIIQKEIQPWSHLSSRKRPGVLTVQQHSRPNPIQQTVVRDLPNPQDQETILALGKMTFDAYYDPNDKSWMPVPGYNVSHRFGWESTGIRGYVFADESDESLVIVIKGTSLATPIGSGPTASEDKYNDNIMFSCCCAKASWEWTPICGCPLASKQCSVSCLLKESNFDKSYYNLAQTIYLAVKEWNPRATIWMTGHSLGGALASLVALTNDLPAFAFEAPGDLMYASRLGLLPDIPDEGALPDYTDFLRGLPIYHYGNVQDPIFMGECTGISSSCYWFDYALESKCHVGYECIYFPPKVVHPYSQMASNIKYHSIEYVIKNYLEKDPPPLCAVKYNCLKDECKAWEWVA